MEKYLMAAQGFLAAVIAWLGNRLGILFPMLGVLCVLMIIDYATGMSASKKEALDHPENPAYGWCSKKGAKGIMKKVGYISVVTVAVIMDYMIALLAQHLGLGIHRSVFFGILVTAWYILNEALSITENASRLDADVPKWMLKYIAVLKKKIDDKGEGAE